MKKILMMVILSVFLLNLNNLWSLAPANDLKAIEFQFALNRFIAFRADEVEPLDELERKNFKKIYNLKKQIKQIKNLIYEILNIDCLNKTVTKKISDDLIFDISKNNNRQAKIQLGKEYRFIGDILCYFTNLDKNSNKDEYLKYAVQFYKGAVFCFAEKDHFDTREYNNTFSKMEVLLNEKKLYIYKKNIKEAYYFIFKQSVIRLREKFKKVSIKMLKEYKILFNEKKTKKAEELITIFSLTIEVLIQYIEDYKKNRINFVTPSEANNINKNIDYIINTFFNEINIAISKFILINGDNLNENDSNIIGTDNKNNDKSKYISLLKLFCLIKNKILKDKADDKNIKSIVNQFCDPIQNVMEDLNYLIDNVSKDNTKVIKKLERERSKNKFLSIFKIKNKKYDNIKDEIKEQLDFWIKLLKSKEDKNLIKKVIEILSLIDVYNGEGFYNKLKKDMAIQLLQLCELIYAYDDDKRAEYAGKIGIYKKIIEPDIAGIKKILEKKNLKKEMSGKEEKFNETNNIIKEINKILNVKPDFNKYVKELYEKIVKFFSISIEIKDKNSIDINEIAGDLCCVIAQLYYELEMKEYTKEFLKKAIGHYQEIKNKGLLKKIKSDKRYKDIISELEEEEILLTSINHKYQEIFGKDDIKIDKNIKIRVLKPKYSNEIFKNVFICQKGSQKNIFFEKYGWSDETKFFLLRLLEKIKYDKRKLNVKTIKNVIEESNIMKYFLNFITDLQLEKTDFIKEKKKSNKASKKRNSIFDEENSPIFNSSVVSVIDNALNKRIKRMSQEFKKEFAKQIFNAISA